MEGCQYPVQNKFATAVAPKPCGSTDGAIVVSVPYFNRSGEQVMQMQVLCNEHTSDVAVWKFIKNIRSADSISEPVEIRSFFPASCALEI